MSLNFSPLDITPGLILDDSGFTTRQGGWTALDKVRFWRDMPQVIGGWESLSTELITGKCRGTFGWRDNDGNDNIAFGTHEGLFVYIGGKIYDITPTDFVTGNEDGLGGSGFGIGGFGQGPFGTSGSVVDTFPLTWSFGRYGEWLIACARGQKIWAWKNDTSVVAAVVTNAPTKVNSIQVINRQIVAYACNEEVSGTWNPACIRWSDIEDITDWTTATDNNAGENILQDAGEILATLDLGQIALVLTDEGCFYQQFIGDIGQTYIFERVGSHCGVIGPCAAAQANNQAFWLARDGKFRTYALGGGVQLLESPVSESLSDNIAPAQQEKVFAATISKFNEIWWFYPHVDDGLECSRYLCVNTKGQWSSGILARTAFLDAAPYEYPIGVNPDGKTFIHERGKSANGDVLSWSASTGDIVVAESGKVAMIDRMRPDIYDQSGNITLTIKSRIRPQGSDIQTSTFILTPGQEEAYPGVSGSILLLTFSGSATQASARLGRSEYDFKIRGNY